MVLKNFRKIVAVHIMLNLIKATDLNEPSELWRFLKKMLCLGWLRIKVTTGSFRFSQKKKTLIKLLIIFLSNHWLLNDHLQYNVVIIQLNSLQFCPEPELLSVFGIFFLMFIYFFPSTTQKHMCRCNDCEKMHDCKPDKRKITIRQL